MPRLARAVAVGFAHHITQRGNNRRGVFFVDDDRRVYLELLREQAERYALEVIGYCLMSNHVHIVAIPHAEDSLAKAVGRTHFRYAQYINRFHRRSGHLWQGRFYSCALDERHFWLAMKYVELNPVRARLCRKAWRYEWSSAAAHVDGAAGSELLNVSRWYDEISAAHWRRELAEGLSDAELARVRSSTHTGRPLGGDSFLSKLEKRLGRWVRPLPVGRPRKKKEVKKRKGTPV
ncbi:MAG TPA: transposase [Sedimentisphaerales bacterium]|nr:transposase [Sedimentisphaerales bacterium]